VDVPPIADWEDELGRLMAHRLRARADSGSGGDLDAEIDRAERRMTARQRRMLRRSLRRAARRPTA
jgi:hypothetical protein